MEVMGLAVIIVLMIIGLFFIIKFNSPKQSDSIEEDYYYTQLGGTFISSLLKTDVENCGLNVKDLISNCYNHVNVCGNSDCNLSRDVINELLSKTIANLTKGYKMIIDKTGFESNSSCSEKSTSRVKVEQIIVLNEFYETANIELYMCKY